MNRQDAILSQTKQTSLNAMQNLREKPYRLIRVGGISAVCDTYISFGTNLYFVSVFGVPESVKSIIAGMQMGLDVYIYNSEKPNVYAKPSAMQTSSGYVKNKNFLHGICFMTALFEPDKFGNRFCRIGKGYEDVQQQAYEVMMLQKKVPMLPEWKPVLINSIEITEAQSCGRYAYTALVDLLRDEVLEKIIIENHDRLMELTIK
jgi:hypothetical protein